jgi:hypothetical protein
LPEEPKILETSHSILKDEDFYRNTDKETTLTQNPNFGDSMITTQPPGHEKNKLSQEASPVKMVSLIDKSRERRSQSIVKEGYSNK